MNSIFFLILRRMRAPLLVLICTNAVAVLGLVLIPGVDPDGNPWRMDFFHAFYFVSFMASTIGFGEIPYAFSGGQRLWVTFSIYSTVVAWIYSIGTLITLVQDPAFRQAVTERRFARMVRRLQDDFFLVCGYGDTGSALVEDLTRRDQGAVVVEIREERASILQMQNLRRYVPVLCGDAGRPEYLLKAGLKHQRCAGVVALTDVNEVNLKIAITAKLLHKDITVICRSDAHDVGANMASFGTDYIIDPFDVFAGHLATALRTPRVYLLYEWLVGRRHLQMEEPACPPRDGLWVICGYGRFGKAVYACLRDEGIEAVVVEAVPEKTGMPATPWVEGVGTEAATLKEARIEQAVGLVAGTADDTNNLSIIMTARQLNPRLFVVARQNQMENQAIIDAVQADMVMRSSAIIANKIRVLLATPLLYEFVQQAQGQEEDWAYELISRITILAGAGGPEIWEVELNRESAYAVCAAMDQKWRITLGHLQRDPRQHDHRLPCMPLLLLQGGKRILLPGPDAPLAEGDRILFCGRRAARTRMDWALQNAHALDYILTGEYRPRGVVWRFLQGGKEKQVQ